MTGDWRRTSWVMSLSALSSFSWSLPGQKSGDRRRRLEEGSFVVSNLPSCRGLERVDDQVQRLGRDVPAWRPLSSSPRWKPARKACEVKGRHVQRAVDGFSMSSFFCNGPVEAEGEEQGTQGVDLSVAQIFSGPNRTKLSFEWQRSQYMAKSGGIRRTSCRKHDLSIWLKAFSRSIVKRHRSSWLLSF